MKKKWLQEDIDKLSYLLKDPFLTLEDISKQINRPISSIRQKKKELGLIKINPKGIKNWIGYKKLFLEVLSLIESRGKQSTWKCICNKCNTEFICTASDLSHGKSSCGCYSNEQQRIRKYKGYGKLSATKFKRIKDTATRRNIDFKVTIEEIYNLFEKQNERCALSNIEIDLFPQKNKINDCTASLDRIDSLKSYTIDNVQWVHKDINSMKWQLDQSYFINLCKKIAENN